jgi:hypothetical protein
VHSLQPPDDLQGLASGPRRPGLQARGFRCRQGAPSQGPRTIKIARLEGAAGRGSIDTTGQLRVAAAVDDGTRRREVLFSGGWVCLGEGARQTAPDPCLPQRLDPEHVELCQQPIGDRH